MPLDESIIPPHGGYRNLKSFQIGQLIYDVTVRFCDGYIDRRSRTHDQMVQAARSGVQNIAEGSQVSGTSKKLELKLTNVARASLEELRLDYEDFLRQRGLPLWQADHEALQRFRKRRCRNLRDFRKWVAEEHEMLCRAARTIHENPHHDKASVTVRVRPDQKQTAALIVANGALSLLNLCCYFLDRQLAAQAEAFEKEEASRRDCTVFGRQDGVNRSQSKSLAVDEHRP